MTDTMGGGRGGVGIRLFVQGGEVVKRTFDQVGDSGKKMWAEIALGERAANPALRAMSRASGEAQDGVRGLGARAGAAGNVLGAFGAAGVGAAAAMGALAVAVGQAKEAMRFADEIDDAASKLNIGVEALQEYRFAIRQVGGEATDADAALDGFQKKMGEAMAGGRSVRWFKQLGFDADGLREFKSTDAALQAVIDRISDLGTEAERAAIAEKLGLGPLIPLLRDGAEEVARLRQAARDLGYVMEEDLIRKGAEANQKFEDLSYVVGVQLKTSFVELSDEIVGFVQVLADALSGLNDFIDRFQEGRQIAAAAYGAKNLADMESNRPWRMARGLTGAALNVARGRTGEVMGAVSRGESLAAPFDRDAVRALAATPQERDRPASLTPPPASARGGGRSDADREAERREREAARALEELTRLETRQTRDAPGIMFDGVPGGQATIAREMLRLDTEERNAAREALRARLETNKALTEEVQARLDVLAETEAFLDVQRKALIDQEEARELAAARLAAETAADQDAIDLLAIDEQMARTGRERLEIARRRLLAEQELERKALEELGDKRTSAEDDALARMLVEQGREVELFDHQSREEMRAQFHSYGREVVDAIRDGRIGEHIAEEMQARLIDMALDGLFDFLNPQGGGGNGGGGGGFWSSAASFVGSLFGGGSGPGRAGGGDLWRGVRHPVAETGRPELMLIGGKGQVTGAAETARLLAEASGGSGANGGRTTVIEHRHSWDLRGAVVTEDLLRQMDEKARAAEARATVRSAEIARRGAGARQQEMRRLGT